MFNKKLKQVTALLLVIIIMILESGCNMRIYDEKLLQKNAIRYMEKKYGKDVKLSIKHAYQELGVYNIFFDVEDHEDWNVFLYWDFEEKKFSDNYMSWVFQKQVEEAFYPLFRKVYGNCKIFNIPYGFQLSNRYNYDTELEDYLSTVSASLFSLFTYSNAETKEEDLQKICNLIKSKGWEADISIMYVTEKDIIKITRENFEERFGNEDYTWRNEVMIFHDKEPFIDYWREGKPQ